MGQEIFMFVTVSSPPLGLTQAS